MIDLSNQTIKQLFHDQVKELTMRTLRERENTLDYQLSGGWIR